MALNFPSNPSDGDTYGAYTYNATLGTWDASTAVTVPTGVGTTVYDSASLLPLTGNDNGEQAFVSANNHLYIWNGSGWYNIALINTAPSITDSGAGVYELATDGTPTVISLTANDPEGIPLTWSYSVTSGALGGTTVSNDSSEFTITPTTNEDSSAEFTLTFTASDGINIATAVNQFSLNFSNIVENSKYTSALITSISSTNGGTNSTITDASSNNHTVTVSGNSGSIQAFSPYRAGGYSYHSNGAQQAYTTGLDLSSGDFTIECWYYYSVVENNTSIRPVFHIGEGYPSYGVGFRRRYSNFSGIYANSASFNLTESDYVNQWMHLAIVVTSSNSATYYVNGVSQATQSVNFVNKANLPLSILSYVSGVSWDNNFYDNNGYITDLRVTNSAVYTGNFTPPTERLQSIANTILLTAHLPYLNDMTHAGTHAEAKPFTPYDYDYYDAAVHGGSVYFDGSGDYHDQQINAIGTSDFTLECWVYHEVDVTNEDGVFTLSGGYGAANASTGLFLARFHSLYTAEAGSARNIDTTNEAQGFIPIGSWYHYAVSRSSGTTTVYYNGEAVWSGADSTNYTNTYLRIGSYYQTSTVMQGYVSDFRIVIGSAVYTSNFTPPTEPLTAIAGTELLLSYGADVSIADKTQSNELTLVGNTQSSTSQTKYGSSSMYFDGTGDELRTTNKVLENDDFTVEGWVYLNSTTGQEFIMIQGPSGSTTNETFMVYRVGTTFYTQWGSGSAYTTATVSENQWFHFAVTHVRSTDTAILYINGSSAGTFSTASRTIGDYPLILGSRYSATYLNGYLEDVRITNGLARYTANFTPPTEALLG